MTKNLGLNHRLGRTTSMILLGAILILLASAALVLATQVVYLKEHHPASTFQISGTDGYRPGDEIAFHLHLNVTSSSPLGGNLDITNLTMTDVLPAGLTYVPGSQISEPTATSFSISSQTLMWNWSSQVLSSGAAPPLPDSPSNVGYTASVLLNATVDASVPDNTFLVNNGQAAYKEVLTGSVSSPSTTDTIIVARPVLSIVKSGPAKVENGSSFNYTLVLTNTGHVDATGVVVTDNMPAGVTHNPPATATSGSFTTDTATQVVWTGTLGNVTGGANTATITIPVTVNTAASSVTDNANYTSFPSDAIINATASTFSATTTVIHPAISLTKTASASKVENGTSVTYTYNTTNTGDTSLTVGLVDDTFGTIFTGKVLAVGASNITTVTTTITMNTTNIATATGVDQTGASVNANASATVQVIHPDIALTKTASASKVENGSTVTYTYNVTNTGDTALTVSLVDDTFGTIFTGKTLAAGASNITIVSQVLTENTTNVATVTGVDQTGASVNANATATVQVIHPAIALTKTASPSTPQIAPANFTYTYNVTNIGDVTLSGVTVYDQTFNVLILGPVTLSAGQSATGTFGPVTYPNAGNFTNIANTTGTDQTGAEVTAFANATVVVLPPSPSLATRTIGFWQTHTNFTEWVFDNKLSGFIPIDSSSPHFKNITTYGELFGAFYSSIPKNTDGTKRPPIDQARMILLQQLVGAILNHAASGVTVPIDSVTGMDLITAGNVAYSSNNATEMLRVKDLLDTFNGSGEIVAFPPSLPPQGSATPQASQAIANKAFWNSPL